MFLNPDDTVKLFLIHEDWHIADLGAGSGAYTLAAVKYVPMGKVYAIDINRDILPYIKTKVLNQGHENIEVVWGDIEREGGTNIGDLSMDAVIFANTFFQVENKDAALWEIKRILKIGGKVFFVDWNRRPSHTGYLQDVYFDMGARDEDFVFPGVAKSVFEKSGFVFRGDIPAGEYHYGMVFSKK